MKAAPMKVARPGGLETVGDRMDSDRIPDELAEEITSEATDDGLTVAAQTAAVRAVVLTVKN